MNTTSGFRLGQLPGLARQCVRYASTGKAAPPAKPKKPMPKGYPMPEGHGEKIWIFSHRRSNQTIYSFKGMLDGFHDLKQLPFNGKKTKPAKLRKDYWYKMALIEFPAGKGSVGRSVYQKLRELKHLHEVSWPDELRYKSPEEYTYEEKKKMKEMKEQGNDYRPIRSKHERGLAINAQRLNSIADMAAILAGQGAGNKIVAPEKGGGEQKLVDVTVSWSNGQDKEYAEAWSSNVTHKLFEDSPYLSEQTQETAPETAPPAAASS